MLIDEFGYCYYYLEYAYHFNFIHTEKLNNLVLTLSRWQDMARTKEEISKEKEEKFILVTNQKRDIDNISKKLSIYDNRIQLCCGPKIVYEEWKKIRKDFVKLYLDTLKIKTNEYFRVFDLNSRIKIPFDKIREDMVSVLFPDAKLLKTISNPPTNKLSYLAAYFQDNEDKRGSFLSINTEQKEDGNRVVEFCLGFPFFNLPPQGDALETAEQSFKVFDALVETIAKNFIAILIEPS